MSVELDLLVARLGWPIASTRWWSMQELSELLLSPELGAAVSARLLNELRSCRLEAEAVEVLCVFWMAVMRGFAPPSGIADAVLRPSILASLLLEEMGLGLSNSPNPPLVAAPADFEIPSDFFDVQGSQVPRIYLTKLRWLESYSNLPFVHQCAFEWAANREEYPEAPFQGDLGYFIRPMGKGMTGTFTPRATLRMLSAYQRTLSVAQQHWRAPEELMRHFALDALPVDPTLAFLRPARPSWMPPLGLHINADDGAIETFIRETTQALEASHHGSLLLALITPTYVSREEIVELSVVRWQQWAETDVDANQLEARFQTRIENGAFGRCKTDGISPRTALPISALSVVVDEETQAAPMAAVCGFDRVGYLQRDLYPDRLYYPVVTTPVASLLAEPMSAELSVCSDRGQMATLSYWNAGWGPVHPVAMGGLCGTALVGKSDHFQSDAVACPDRYFYLWTLRRFRKQDGYGDLTEEVRTGVVFV